MCRFGADRGQGIDAEILEPVGTAFEGQDVSVVDDAVDHRGGDALFENDRTVT